MNLKSELPLSRGRGLVSVSASVGLWALGSRLRTGRECGHTWDFRVCSDARLQSAVHSASLVWLCSICGFKDILDVDSHVLKFNLLPPGPHCCALLSLVPSEISVRSQVQGSALRGRTCVWATRDPQRPCFPHGGERRTQACGRLRQDRDSTLALVTRLRNCSSGLADWDAVVRRTPPAWPCVSAVGRRVWKRLSPSRKKRSLPWTPPNPALSTQFLSCG